MTFFFLYLVGMRICRKVFFTLLVPTRVGAQTKILRLEIIVYNWLLLVIRELIISRN